STYMSDLDPNTPLDKFDPAQVTYLQTFLALCRDHNLTLIFYIPPYHPRLFAYYKQTTTFDSATASLLELLAAWRQENHYSFTVHDYADINSFAGTSEMFLDAIHPTENAGQLMAAMLVGDIPRAN